MGNLILYVFGVIAFAYVLWIVISIFIARLARSALLGVSLAVAPLVCWMAYMGFTIYIHQKIINVENALNDRLVASANAYLEEKCNTERSLVSTMPVSPLGGVLIDNRYSKKKLNLPDVPNPPVGRLTKRRNTSGDENIPRRMHKVQYETPVSWSYQMFASYVLDASRFAFVEQHRSVESGLDTSARKAWWSSIGLSQIRPDRRAEFERDLKNSSRTNTIWRKQVISSIAKYELLVQDVSSTVDRQHWVARIEATLKDRESGKTAARYLGFVANKIPVFDDGYPQPTWSLVNVCPGSEQAYQRKDWPWDFDDFFFREVVRYE